MADNGDTGETGENTGGFVFGDEPADDESGATIAGFDAGNIAAAALLVVAVVVLVYVAQLLVTGAVTDLLGGDAGEGAVPNGTAAGTTTPTGMASETGTIETETVSEPATTDAATEVQQTGASSPTAQTPTATATATPTSETTPTPTQTAEDDGTGGEDGTGSGTVTPDERSPVIETLTVTDRSGGGAAVFDVAWNVTDPNRDLVDVTVTLVADPDGEARIVERRRFDAGGARTTGNTTFEVADGADETYEVRIEVVDGAGNTAFSLTRAVADGSSDE